MTGALVVLAALVTPGGGVGEDLTPAFLLEEILVIPGVSGHEEGVREAIKNRLPKWAARIAEVDGHGNLIVQAGEGDPSILFVAHMDEIGFEVVGMGEDGSLQVQRKGGFLPSLYEGEIVEVHGREVAVPGVVPPRSDRGDRFEYGSVRVDVGTSSPDETAKLGVAVGDTVTVPKQFDRLLGKRLMGRSMDDRVGSAALLWAIRQVDPEKLPRQTTFTWSTREEIGLVGAAGMAETRKPTYVFPVDTYVSSDSPRENPRFGHVRLGEGAVVRAIDRSNIAPYADVMRVVELAKKREIPIDYGVTGGGNDGSAFVPGGAVDIPIAWPLRNSHTAVEIIDERDLDSLSRLIVAIAEEF